MTKSKLIYFWIYCWYAQDYFFLITRKNILNYL